MVTCVARCFALCVNCLRLVALCTGVLSHLVQKKSTFLNFHLPKFDSRLSNSSFLNERSLQIWKQSSIHAISFFSCVNAAILSADAQLLDVQSFKPTLNITHIVHRRSASNIFPCWAAFRSAGALLPDRQPVVRQTLLKSNYLQMC